MKLNVPNFGDVSIDFQYIRIPRTVDISVNGSQFFSRTVTWKLKTICTLQVGETGVTQHVWKSSPHEHGFCLKEERKRALSKALLTLWPSEKTWPTWAENKHRRRAIWAALHAAGFHPFPVSKVDRLTKLLEKAKKRAKKRGVA